MQTIAAIKSRRSIRNFSLKPLANELVEQIVDCARLAPTARNIQPWEFVAITRKENLQMISELAENGRFIRDCACCIAVFCQDTKYYLEDGCAATENILIAAADLGICACWVAGDKKPYSEQVRQIAGAPAGLKLVSLIALGFGQENASEPEKRPLKEVLHWEKF